MSTEEENDISNILIDAEFLSNSQFNFDLSNEDKPTVKCLKSHLKCVVCGDNAFGYNFDAISCESRKAFFRRNALRPLGKLKCRSQSHCAVTVETRKRCKKCRLDKCFRMGMRKEWILSDEEKRRKKHKIEENRRRKQSQEHPKQSQEYPKQFQEYPKQFQEYPQQFQEYPQQFQEYPQQFQEHPKQFEEHPNQYQEYPKQSQEHSQRYIRHRSNNSKTDNSNSDDGPFSRITTDDTISLMSELDWSRIHQIQTAYSEAMAYNQVVGVPPYPATHSINSTLDLIQVPTYLSSIRLITYLKKTPGFDSFDAEDRVTLIKHNLLAAVFMHIALIYDPIADTYHEHNTKDPIFQGKDWIKILGEDFYHELTDTVMELIHVLEYDRVIVKLLLIIVLCIKGFCSYDILHEPSLNNPSLVINTQHIYVEILFKYCLHQYGLTKTTNLFTHLINELFAIQRLSVHLKDLVHSVIGASQLSPLMQTVLQLSDSPTSSEN